MSNTGITPTVGAIALAGVASTLLLTAGFTASNQQSGLGLLATWANIANGIAGVPFLLGQWRCAFFAGVGTFGSAGSVQIEGSNDGTNWYALSPAALTSAGLFSPLKDNELPLYVRPHVTAGDGTTSLTITAWFKL